MWHSIRSMFSRLGWGLGSEPSLPLAYVVCQDGRTSITDEAPNRNRFLTPEAWRRVWDGSLVPRKWVGKGMPMARGDSIVVAPWIVGYSSAPSPSAPTATKGLGGAGGAVVSGQAAGDSQMGQQFQANLIHWTKGLEPAPWAIPAFSPPPSPSHLAPVSTLTGQPIASFEIAAPPSPKAGSTSSSPKPKAATKRRSGGAGKKRKCGG